MKFRTATTLLFICILTFVKAQKMPAISAATPSCAPIENKNQQFSSNESPQFWKNESFSSFNQATEINHLRDENTKHFRYPDGTVTAFIAAGKIHYKEDNNWKTIFHTISPTNTGFENVTNAHKTFFPSTLGQPLKTILPDGSELKDLLGLEFYFEGNGQKTIPKRIQSKKGEVNFNELVYPALDEGSVDVRLTQNTTQRKMDFILRNASILNTIPQGAEFMVFRELVELPAGWKASLVNEEILLFDASGNLQLKYNRPVFHDSKEENHDHQHDSHEHDSHEFFEQQNHVRKEIRGNFELSQNGNQLEILTKVPLVWLTAPERVFPIYIDPTLTFTPNNSAGWTGTHEIYSSATSSNLSTSSTYTNSNINSTYDDILYLGRHSAQYVLNAWAKFNITGLPSNACVISASVNYYVY